MNDLTPYAAPQDVGETPLPKHRSSPNRLLFGFLLAPAVAPVLITAVLLAIVTMLGGITDAALTPWFLLAAVMGMGIGLGCSYVLATTVGLPIVLVLRRKGKLNAVTLIATTLLLTLLAALTFSLLNVNQLQLDELAMLLGVTFLFLSPFTLLSTFVFWWIVCRPTNLDASQKPNASPSNSEQ